MIRNLIAAAVRNRQFIYLGIVWCVASFTADANAGWLAGLAIAALTGGAIGAAEALLDDEAAGR